MTKILVIGGGYAGLYAARGLERLLRKGEAEITVVDPRGYMQYLPFLPEVAAGSIEPRHAVVPLRRHLSSNVVAGSMTALDHDRKVATIQPLEGEAYDLDYDVVIVTAGSVTRTFPIPGVADVAVGMKTIEEAQFARDTLTANFLKASSLPAGPERDRLLTVVVVGGGFAGVETIAELRDFASRLVRRYPTIAFEDTKFHLIEAMGRIMPEVSLKQAEWVVGDLANRGATVHLDTQLKSAVDGNCELSTGETISSDLIIWTAGVMPNPSVAGTTLPRGQRGHIIALPTLQVATEDGEVVEGAWTAGDVSQVPDISKTPGPGGFCVPNAQHAVRQGKLLAKNVVAVLRGEKPREYNHTNEGAVAGLGLWNGVFQKGKFSLHGPLAWLAHRGYHGLAMPMWERKWRVFGDWFAAFFNGNDEVGIIETLEPKAAFQRYASRPKPPAPEADAAAPAAATKA